MMIQSSVASRLCQVSKQRFHQLARLLKLREQGMRRGHRGQPERYWSLSQVAAMCMLPQLCRLGVHEDAAAGWCQKFAAGSDEGWEHALLTGRRWALICGSGIAPEVLPRESAEMALLKRAEQLAELGITPVIVDIGTSYLEMLAVVRAELAQGSKAPAE